MKTPQEILDLLDDVNQKYIQCKEEKLSRFSQEWGMWSRSFNRNLQDKIKEQSEFTLLYQYLFIYWINRSKLLELHFKHPSIFTKRKAKKEEDESGKILREYIRDARVLPKETLKHLQSGIDGAALKLALDKGMK